jgi:lactobin A/cerein 7B family class IIb bacteriocin
MKVMNQKEIEQVNGGIIPLIGAGIAAYSHFTATTVAGAILGRVGLALAVYSFGEYLNES